MLACLKENAALELYTMNDTVNFYSCIKSEASSLQSNAIGGRFVTDQQMPCLYTGSISFAFGKTLNKNSIQNKKTASAHLGLRPTGRMGASNRPF